jgi:hypothetical protein
LKRLFGALAVGSIVFGAVLVSAANLNVNGGIIQVGTDATLACDADGVTVDWNTGYTGIVTSVNVNGVDDVNCAGQTLYVYALDLNGLIVGAPHSPSVACGAPGTPLPVAFAPIVSGTTTYKVALLFVDPRDDGLGSATYPCGVNGSLIEGVRIVIGV